ncbi:MAG: hypothetical protein ACI93N_000970 [Flavobacteriaceae bacterium]|jgi:hypothetical protein
MVFHMLNSQLGEEVFMQGLQEITHINKPASVEIENINIYNVLGQLIKEQKHSKTVVISDLITELLFVPFETN